MRSLGIRRPRARHALATALALAVGALLLLAVRGDAEGARRTKPPEPPPVVAPPEPVVRDTRSNLEDAFDREMNGKEWYLAVAKRADLEGHPEVGRLARACAEAEQVHADRQVTAIAWTGGHAKAILQRFELSTTAENLKASIERERWEAEHYYPALLARARADHEPQAVRAFVFAVQAERDHLQLLRGALDALDRHPPLAQVLVCPYCGHTFKGPPTRTCPNCFTGGRRFITVS